MSFLLSTALKDLRRRSRDPLSLVLWAGIPITIALLISLALGRDGRQPQAQLLVDDRDDSFLSALLVGAFEQGPLAELVSVERVEPAVGRERLDRGKASALLVVPAGFGAAVLREQPAQLTLVTNPAQSILPGIVEEALGILVDAVFYLQRLLRAPLAEIVEGPAPEATILSDSSVASISVTINRLVDRAGPLLFPPAIELETRVAGGEAETQASFPELFFPGMLVLALMFIAQGLSEDLWKERSQRTLRRALVTPHPLFLFLAGKMLAGAVVVGGVSLIGLLAGRWLFGRALANLPLALVWLTLAGTALLAIVVLVQLHATSERAGNLLTFVVIFPLAMAGGSFFPFEVMPEWLAAIGRFTPNGWALTQLTAILRGRVHPGDLALASAAVLFMGLIAFTLSARRLARGFARG